MFIDISAEEMLFTAGTRFKIVNWTREKMMATYEKLNYKNMTKDELYNLLVAEFDNVEPEIKADVFKHRKHHTFEEWKALLKLALDDLIIYC